MVWEVVAYPPRFRVPPSLSLYPIYPINDPLSPIPTFGANVVDGEVPASGVQVDVLASERDTNIIPVEEDPHVAPYRNVIVLSTWELNFWNVKVLF